jgi:hypothetical protein
LYGWIKFQVRIRTIKYDNTLRFPFPGQISCFGWYWSAGHLEKKARSFHKKMQIFLKSPPQIDRVVANLLKRAALSVPLNPATR